MARPKDETYVIDLCDECLGLKASRGHRFDSLRGDKGRSGKCVRLPVDAYYNEIKLVVEFHERQHSEPVGHFDERKTVSGVRRSEQRKIYDQRRIDELPKLGIKLVILSYSEFSHDSAKKLRRVEADRDVIEKRLSAI